jgi:hypothetical protein
MMWRRLAAALKREGFPQDGSSWYYVRSKAFPTWIPAPYDDDGFADCESIAVPDLLRIIHECGAGRFTLDRISSRRRHARLITKNKRLSATGMFPEEAAARLWLALKNSRN